MRKIANITYLASAKFTAIVLPVNNVVACLIEHPDTWRLKWGYWTQHRPDGWPDAGRHPGEKADDWLRVSDQHQSKRDQQPAICFNLVVWSLPVITDTAEEKEGRGRENVELRALAWKQPCRKLKPSAAKLQIRSPSRDTAAVFKTNMLAEPPSACNITAILHKLILCLKKNQTY